MTVGGTYQVDQTLTATATPGSNNAAFTGDFVWESADSATAATWTTVSGATGDKKSQLKLTADLENKYVRAKAGDKESNAKQVTKVTTPPGNELQPGTVRINEDFAVLGSAITATSLDDDVANVHFTGDFTWEYTDSEYTASNYADQEHPYWNRITTNIDGTDKNSLALNQNLNGYYIRVKRSYETGIKYSRVLLIVAEEPKVSISGTPQIGATIRATSTDQGFSGIYTWESADENSETATWSPILVGFEGTDQATLIITANANLVGKYIRAKRTCAAASAGELKSNVLGKVTDASGNTGGSGTGSSNPIDDLLDAIGGAAGGTGGTAGFGAAGNAASNAAQPVREVLDSRERSYADAGMSSGW